MKRKQRKLDKLKLTTYTAVTAKKWRKWRWKVETNQTEAESQLREKVAVSAVVALQSYHKTTYLDWHQIKLNSAIYGI